MDWGDEEKAREVGEAGLALARALNLEETLAYTLNDLHWVYVSLGEIRQAQTYLEEAVAHWRALSNIPMLLDSLNGSGLLYSLVGAFDQALAAGEEGAELAEVHWQYLEPDYDQSQFGVGLPRTGSL